MAKTYDINGIKVVHEKRGWAVYDRNGEELNVLGTSYGARTFAHWQSHLTPLAVDAATVATQQEEIQTNLRNCKCVVVETPRR